MRPASAPNLAMGMRPGDKDTEQEDRDARRQHDAAERALCVKAVTDWNRLMERRYKPRWSPTLGVALAAGFYWLDLFGSRLPPGEAGRSAEARSTSADDPVRADPEAQLHGLPTIAAIRTTGKALTPQVGEPVCAGRSAEAENLREAPLTDRARRQRQRSTPNDRGVV